MHEEAAQAQARLASGAEPYRIYACNAAVFALWAEAWSCWRWVSGGMAPPRRLGIDWVQVRALLGYEPGRGEWETLKAGLREMQAEALDAMYSK